MPLRPITPSTPPRWELTNQNIAVNGGFNVIGMSRDRSKFYSNSIGTVARNGLDVSTDGGVTWTRIRNLYALAPTLSITGFVETYDGEVLVQMSAGGTYGRLFKSSGWAANPATCTFTQVHSYTSGVLDYYGLHEQCQSPDGFMITADGGPQTLGIQPTNKGTGYTTATVDASALGGTGATFGVSIIAGKIERIAVLTGGTGYSAGALTITGDGINAAASITVSGGVIAGVNGGTARKLWKSLNYGATWTEIYDIYTSPAYKYGVGMHFHGLTYDQDWDRVYALFGDNTGDGLTVAGAGNTQVLYSDDRGTTWNFLPVDAQFGQSQYTAIRATKFGLLLGTDAVYTAGVYLLPKTGFKTFGQWLAPISQAHSGGAIYLNFRSPQSSNGLTPMFIAMNCGTAITSPIVCSDDGYNWSEIWTEPDPVARPPAAYKCADAFWGPDLDGRVVANYVRSPTNMLITATLKKNY